MHNKFSIKYFYLLIIIFTLAFNNVTAQTSSTTKNVDYMSTINGSISDTGKLIENINKNIVGNIVTLLSSLAFALFLFGLVRFIYDRSRGDETRLEKDKSAMTWGLIALFVLISIWGIIKMFQGFLGIENSGNINLPKICTSGSCDTKSVSANDTSAGIKDKPSFDKPTDKLKTQTALNSAYDIEAIRWWANNLKEGDGSPNGSDEIAQLQLFLKEHSYASYLGNTGPNKDGVDGIFGPKTTLAVKAFQKNNALVPDGIVGYGTKAVILYRYMNAKPERDLYHVDLWPNIMTNNQSKDSNTDGAVSNLQQFLLDQGANLGTTGMHGNGIDGIYGGKTTDALVAFQAKFYLKEDNLVGPSTKAVIMFVENRNN